MNVAVEGAELDLLIVMKYDRASASACLSMAILIECHKDFSTRIIYTLRYRARNQQNEWAAVAYPDLKANIAAFKVLCSRINAQGINVVNIPNMMNGDGAVMN